MHTRDCELNAQEIEAVVAHTQNGPATPYSYATVLAWSKVAAQVHAETIPLAIKPGFTLLLAVLNSSLVLVENLVYLFCTR